MAEIGYVDGERVRTLVTSMLTDLAGGRHGTIDSSEYAVACMIIAAGTYLQSAGIEPSAELAIRIAQEMGALACRLIEESAGGD